MPSIGCRENLHIRTRRCSIEDREGAIQLLPKLTYYDGLGQDHFVKFDGIDGAVLVDRKWNITMHPKVFDQAARQSWALRVNGMVGRWEVPTARIAKRAQSI